MVWPRHGGDVIWRTTWSIPMGDLARRLSHHCEVQLGLNVRSPDRLLESRQSVHHPYPPKTARGRMSASEVPAKAAG